MSTRAILFAALCLAGLSAGCAIHHFDDETGTEHIWGIGHMKMRVAEPNEGVRAVVGQTQTLGVGVGSVQESGYAVIGWQRLTRLLAIDADTAIRFEWPDSDLFNVRVGAQPSWVVTEDAVATQFDREEEP